MKFPEADARRFKNIFVCRRCKTKIKAPSLKVIEGKITCRACGGKVMRTIKRK